MHFKKLTKCLSLSLPNLFPTNMEKVAGFYGVDLCLAVIFVLEENARLFPLLPVQFTANKALPPAIFLSVVVSLKQRELDALTGQAPEYLEKKKNKFFDVTTSATAFESSYCQKCLVSAVGGLWRCWGEVSAERQGSGGRHETFLHVFLTKNGRDRVQGILKAEFEELC